MALNPFFLQGAQSEQRLIQDLINEQLQIYGVEVTYIPRKYVRKQTIIEEVQSSKFDDNFALEAYVNTYEGYSGAGDVLTKFGVSLRDEVVLTISKERFEDFISPFLESEDADEIEVASRPREGDLVYFPLGQRLFEIKFVEHEKPFYQLGKTYVYEIQCELFEYEDEVIDTGIEEIDEQVQEEGYITTLQLVGSGVTATATAAANTGYVREIFLNDDGSGYTSIPTVTVSAPPPSGVNATAVAITTVRGGVHSIESIRLTNAGTGYTTSPTITFAGGGGSGAAATCSIETTLRGVTGISVVEEGRGYAVAPSITFVTTGIGVSTPTAVAVMKPSSHVGLAISSFQIIDPGSGMVGVVTVTISDPPVISNTDNYNFNELVNGSVSGTQARVKDWDFDTKILKVSNVGIGTTAKGFAPGEVVTGAASSAAYSVQSFILDDIYDEYASNDEIETEADLILDFTQSNPFGQV
tara:strand:+ start:5320 stop:6726 length:1407 start_codon:yes stop_codon:yes gene_type:complete